LNFFKNFVTVQVRSGIHSLERGIMVFRGILELIFPYLVAGAEKAAYKQDKHIEIPKNSAQSDMFFTGRALWPKRVQRLSKSGK
jgi:hypothetical protein